MKRITDVLDNMDVKYEISGSDVLIEFWTDTAGQDVPTEFSYNGSPEDFVNQFKERAESYDVDDEMQVYIPMLGKNGVPESTTTLLEDLQEAKNTLMEIAEKLEKAIEPSKEVIESFTGKDLLSNILEELEKAAGILKETDYDEADETAYLLADIQKDIDTLYNYQDDIEAALKPIEIDYAAI